MADYPNMVFETFSAPTPHAGDDMPGFTQEDFATPLSLGFKTCRLIGAARFCVNKIWDPGGGGHWVIWETSVGDPGGEHYPDPYGSGFGACSGFRSAGFQRYR